MTIPAIAPPESVELVFDCVVGDEALAEVAAAEPLEELADVLDERVMVEKKDWDAKLCQISTCKLPEDFPYQLL